MIVLMIRYIVHNVAILRGVRLIMAGSGGPCAILGKFIDTCYLTTPISSDEKPCDNPGLGFFTRLF